MIDSEDTVDEEVVSPLSQLFVAAGTATVSNRGNQLSATADLTFMSEQLTNDITKEVLSRPDLNDMAAKSIDDNDALDALIQTISPLDDVETLFLKEVSEDDLDKMLRSQQSKRSRAKSKEPRTLESYKTMMTAAIAEMLIRKQMGKPKGSSGGNFDGSDFTDAEIEEFKNDADKLSKAIRNVQSKKSIAKNKSGFDETGDHWQHLLRQEAFLKALRDNSKPVITKEIEEELDAKKQAQEMLQAVESTDDLSGDDAKSMLEKLKNILAAKE
ncbi:hypothetical protein D3C79_696310 [compost metagenome]